MIVDNGKYYLYRHVRLDKNEVFYVGIGTKPNQFTSYKQEYIRAYTKENRNILWKRVFQKTDYKIEILFESDQRTFIEKKEIEFIALYGRKDTGKGILCNLTDGGEGVTGKIFTREQKLKKCIPVHQYSLEGKFIKSFECITDAYLELDILICDIAQAYKNPDQKRSKHTAGGFQWRKQFYDSIEPYNKEKSLRINNKILQFSLDHKFVAEWKSVANASRTLSLGRTAIVNCLNGWSESSFGYIWEYKYGKNQEAKEKRKQERINKANPYILYQYDMNMCLINTFTSISFAANSLNIHHTNISNFLRRGGKHAKGYIWKQEYL